MTMLISAEANITDDERRRRLYDGEVFNLPPRASVRTLTDFAWELIAAAFGALDPTRAFEHLPVEEYVEILGPLKTGFTHHPRSKELLTAALVDLGCDPEKTYFDVPKLRVVTPASYLTAGLGYNYKPHRDTWYSAPPCQVNWWAPIRGLTRESSMAFHPDFWGRASREQQPGVRRLRVESLRAPGRGALRHQRSAAAPSPARWKSRRRGPAPG